MKTYRRKFIGSPCFFNLLWVGFAWICAIITILKVPSELLSNPNLPWLYVIAFAFSLTPGFLINFFFLWDIHIAKDCIAFQSHFFKRILIAYSYDEIKWITFSAPVPCFSPDLRMAFLSNKKIDIKFCNITHLCIYKKDIPAIAHDLQERGIEVFYYKKPDQESYEY